MNNYEEKIYGGVLGKTIGVYIGRPFEGWYKEDIERRFGKVDRYVNEELKVPLVVTDDDLTGTFTFQRVLEDNAALAEAAPECYGDNWLNYIIPGKTILWWGGVGISTEHTAFKNLRNGIKAPHSGSMKQNGRFVAEQIGAQIFIEGFGMVAPGRPELAARLAKNAAQVSHDGAAVDAAVVVAVMASLAFERQNMDALLLEALTFIAADSAICEVHNQVREWVKTDGNWHATYTRIREKYGYDKFGGLCHVIPNHAIMVMSWLYAGSDFDLAMEIINTAGWDTDCNAANVGCILGIMYGAEYINRKTDWRRAFADRLLLPTAEGTFSVTDCANVAIRIAALGRRMAGQASGGYEQAPLHHFQLPGSLHGYMVEGSREHCVAQGEAVPSKESLLELSNPDGNGLIIRGRFSDVTERISTPVLCSSRQGNYEFIGSPLLYSGNKIKMAGKVEADSAPVSLRLFVRCANTGNGEPDCLYFGDALHLQPGREFDAEFTIPELHGAAVYDAGMEITGACGCTTGLIIKNVAWSGAPEFEVHGRFPANAEYRLPGWLTYGDNCVNPLMHTERRIQAFVNNDDRGIFCTGSRYWRDYEFCCRFVKLAAVRSGVVVRYQGLERYLALTFTGGKIQIIRRYYGDTVLFESPRAVEYAEAVELRIVCAGADVRFFADGELLFCWCEEQLRNGAAGYLAEQGTVGAEWLKINVRDESNYPPVL